MRRYNHDVAVGFQCDMREEFVDGRFIELPPPSPGHARLIQRLNEILAAQLGTRDFKILLTAYGLGIEPGLQACRNPDLAVFRTEDLNGARTEGNNLYALPLLIVECLVPRDRKGPLPKLLRDYRRMHAPEVWLIDPRVRNVESHSFLTRPSRKSIITDGVFSPTELPQVSVALQDLWEAFDGA